MTKGTAIALVNQKGGVGKTTTAINLATALAAIGKTALLVDMDPQGNASTGLGIAYQNRAHTVYDLFQNPDALDLAIQKTLVPGLDIIPSHRDLAAIEHELAHNARRTQHIKHALAPARHRYDYIFLDCPPSLGLLTLNALSCAEKLLVPLQCEFYALEGLSHLLETVRHVKEKLNPGLELQGVVLTMHQKRSLLNQEVASEAKQHLGSKVYDTLIPRNIRLSEAPSYGKPALIHDLYCPGSAAYVALAQEFVTRERLC